MRVAEYLHVRRVAQTDSLYGSHRVVGVRCKTVRKSAVLGLTGRQEVELKLSTLWRTEVAELDFSGDS
jgi:hypothetical protein